MFQDKKAAAGYAVISSPLKSRFDVTPAPPRPTHQGAGVGIGPLVQQQLGDTVVAAVRCHVQCCQVVQCDIIHRRLVLQQVLDTLDMVSLGCHVQGGQPVLWGRG